MLADRLRTVALRQEAYLRSLVQTEPSPSRDFYGKAFAAWALVLSGTSQGTLEPGLDSIGRDFERGGDHLHHTEFVRYALRKAKLAEPASVEAARLAYGRAANWTLLRSYVRRTDRSLGQRAVARLETELVLRRNRLPNGFIEDERGLPSSQYHHFSTYLLGQLATIVGSRALREQFLESAWASRRLTLPTGECNYFGRGAFQSFGYASAVATAVLAYATTLDPSWLGYASSCLAHAFERSPARTPLPLSRVNPTAIAGPSGRPWGWWSYNNESDYAAFTSALLLESAVLLAQQPAQPEAAWWTPQLGFQAISSSLALHADETLACLFGAPLRRVTGSQPRPAVSVSGAFVLPPTGGEEDISPDVDPQWVQAPELRVSGRSVVPSDWHLEIEGSTVRLEASVGTARLRRQVTVGGGAVRWRDNAEGFDAQVALTRLHLALPFEERERGLVFRRGPATLRLPSPYTDAGSDVWSLGGPARELIPLSVAPLPSAEYSLEVSA